MHVETTVQGLQDRLNTYRDKGESIGFTPTMGALHKGHISLMEISKQKCDITVCCIFVNPTQFNEQSDLDKYPKTYNSDVELLSNAQVDILFFPQVSEVYPEGLVTEVDLDFSALENIMEGEFRPGHFKGMAQVVKRLLDIVNPNKLFMGQKDFQQAAIVQYMLKELDMPIELCVCPIIREEHGLAMSSRNTRLTPIDKMRAGQLYKSLCYLQSSFVEGKELSIGRHLSEKLLDLPSFKLEYLAIVDGETLQEIKNWEETNYAVACLACWVGEVRLIDNKIIKKS